MAAALRRDPDVLVIGAGIAGLCSAYFLRLAGRTVTVIDSDRVGGPSACSSGNTGFVAYGGAPLAAPGALIRGVRSALRPDGNLALRVPTDLHALRWLHQFRRAGDGDLSQVRRALIEMKSRSIVILRELSGVGDIGPTVSDTGMVMAFRTTRGYSAAVRSLPAAVRDGAPLRELSLGELSTMEPAAEFDIAGALYNDGGVFLRTPTFLNALVGVLCEMGVEVHDGSGVNGFDIRDGAVTAVRTAGGEFRPGEVVIAAGSSSTACARLLGLRLPVAPVRGYTITVERPDNSPSRPVLLHEGTVAVRPLGDRLRIGGSLELAGARTVTRRRVEGVLRTVRAYLPRMALPQVRDVWVGLRPCTPDSLPVIGRHPAYRNVAFACGHGHIGMGLAPVGGRLLAAILTGAAPEMDMTPFRPDRFDTDRLD